MNASGPHQREGSTHHGKNRKKLWTEDEWVREGLPSTRTSLLAYFMTKKVSLSETEYTEDIWLGMLSIRCLEDIHVKMSTSQLSIWVYGAGMSHINMRCLDIRCLRKRCKGAGILWSDNILASVPECRASPWERG